MSDLRVNDLAVIPNSKFSGIVFQVIKVNQVTYKLRSADGFLVNCSKTLAEAYVERGDRTPTPVTASPTVLPARQHFVIGQVVRYNGIKTIAGISTGDLAVVTRDKCDEVQVAKLGGHSDYYGRIRDRKCLELISIEELTKILSATV